MRLSTALLLALSLASCADTREASVGNQSAASDAATFSPSPGPPGERLSRQAVTGSDQPEEAPSVAPASSQGTPPAGSDPVIQPMIIKNGEATIEVDSLELALAAVTQLAQRLGGVVAGSSTQTGRNEIRSASVTLRIPATQFDAAMTGLRPLGKVERQNVSSEDVTEQFVDMTARAKNAKRLEERLINLLATRTGKLEDVLAVERELARVREEIERYEGSLRYLRTRAAISTLTLSLHERYPLVQSPGGTNVIVDALRRAWRNFVGFLAAAISSLGIIIPLALIVLAFVWILRKLGLIPRSGPVVRHPPRSTTGDSSTPPPA